MTDVKSVMLPPKLSRASSPSPSLTDSIVIDFIKRRTASDKLAATYVELSPPTSPSPRVSQLNDTGASSISSTDDKKLVSSADSSAASAAPTNGYIDITKLASYLPPNDTAFTSKLLQYLIRSDQFNGGYPPDSAEARLLDSWRKPGSDQINAGQRACFGAANVPLGLDGATEAVNIVGTAIQVSLKCLYLNSLTNANIPRRFNRNSNAVKCERLHGKIMFVPHMAAGMAQSVSGNIDTPTISVHTMVFVDTMALLSNSAGLATPILLQEVVTSNGQVSSNPNALLAIYNSGIAGWASLNAVANSVAVANDSSVGTRFHILHHRVYNINPSEGAILDPGAVSSTVYPGVGRTQIHDLDVKIDVTSLYSSELVLQPYCNAVYFLVWQSNTAVNPAQVHAYYNLKFDWKDVGEMG